MAFDPVSAGLLLGGGLLQGLFSGQPELPPELQAIFRQLMRAYRDTLAYSKGVPGSDPQEQAALAQARGLAGEDLMQQRQQLLAALTPGSAGASNAADALARFGSNAAGQLAGIDTNFLLQFLRNRQDLRYGGAQGILSGALGAAGGPRINYNPDFAASIGQLAQMLGYARGMNRPFTPPTTGVSFPNSSPPVGLGPGGGFRNYPYWNWNMPEPGYSD